MMWKTRLASALCAAALLTDTSLANSQGKTCRDIDDCASGSICVAGDSETPVQQCVPEPACGANIMGSCPSDPVAGRLACIWREDEKGICDEDTACENRNGTLGIYSCMTIDRCDSYSESKDGCSRGCLASNGKPCNGVGNCQLADADGDLNKFKCSCFTGWSGDTCEVAVDESCVADVGQCGDNGSCVDNKCKCKNGYTGAQCEISPDSGSKETTPTPSKTEGTEVDKESTDQKTGNKSNGSSSATFIVIGILAALLVIAALLFALYSRKKKREQAAQNEPVAAFDPTDSSMQGGAPTTPKQNIVVM